MQGGNGQAAGPLFAVAAERLRRMAVYMLKRESAGTAGLGVSDLVQEVWVQKAFRLSRVAPVQDREHFFSLMARGMKQVLVDRHRIRSAKRRTAPESMPVGTRPDPRVAELTIQRSRLREFDPRAHEILWLKLDEGLTWEEVAERMGLTVSACRAEYDHAIYWLRKRMR